MPWIYSNKILVAFPFVTKSWFLSTKSFDSSFNNQFIFSWCCNLYCWLPWFQHFKKNCIFILAQLILDKLKRFMMIITFEIQSLMQQSCITSFHVICQCMVLHHDRESVDWLMGMRLSTTSWVVFGSYLVVAGDIGLPLLISSVVVFSHVTLMPRRNLDSRVRCSHMIELLGARRCLGMCDVTHCNPFLCNLISVLTSDIYSRV